MAELNAHVSLEAIIHNAFAETAQHIYDTYKVEVNRIAFTFINTSTHGQACRRVRRVDIESSTEPG